MRSTHLFRIVDTLQVKRRNAGAVQGLSNVVFVAGEDLTLQVCTHGMNIIPPAGERRAEKEVCKWGKCGGNKKVESHRKGIGEDESVEIETR